MTDDVFSSDEIMEEAQVFTSRAKDYRETCAEEIQKMLSKIEEDKSKNYTPIRKGRKRKGKKKLQAVPIISENDEFTESVIVTPKIKLQPATKKRLQKLEEKRLKEIERIKAANKYVLSSCNALPEEENPKDPITDSDVLRNKVTLKIRYMSNVTRVTWSINEKFAALFSQIANLFNLKASEILLCINDQNIDVDDTPSSLKLTMFDIIDCIPFKADENSKVSQDTNRFLVKLQSNDSRKKIDVYAHKLERLQDIMERYATLRGIPLQQMIFEFDGDKIDGTETPEELDMEYGSILDVKILNADQKIILPEEDCDIECINIKTGASSSVIPTIDILEDESSSDSEILVLS